MSNHSHLGEVEQPIRCEIGRPLLYKTEVRQVHAQVRNAGRIATMQHFTHCPETTIGTDDRLQFGNRLFDLRKRSPSNSIPGQTYTNNTRKHTLTVFGTLSQVFFRRYTAALVKAAQIWSTPLKLCKHRQISATAVHFSMAATREAILLLWDEKEKFITHLPGRSFAAQLPRYDLGGDQSRSIVESLRHLDYVLSPRLLVRLHPRLSQELPAKETNFKPSLSDYHYSAEAKSHLQLTRCGLPRRFDGLGTSSARQSPMRTVFRCSPCWT